MAETCCGDAECGLTFCRGVLALRGFAVDRCARAGLAAVPEAWQLEQRNRDGDGGFHVTFLTKADLQTVAAKVQDGGADVFNEWPEGIPRPVNAQDTNGVARAAAALVASRPGGLIWTDVGEGRASDGDAEAVFRVLLWPGGSAVRALLLLPPQDFHITLGFHDHDVHGRSKGMPSLVNGVPEVQQLPGLVAAAQHLLQVGIGRDTDIEGVMQFAVAALQGAESHGDLCNEVAALRVLCTVCGRAQRPQDALDYSQRLLELKADDEVGLRSASFAFVALARYEEAVATLARLQHLLQTMPATAETAGVERWSRQAMEKCRKKLGHAARVFPGREDRATESGDNDFEDGFHNGTELKFPSTSHLKNMGAATRDDKLCDANRKRLFCGSGRVISVEEKIDGANLGISLDSMYRFRMQNRSKMVNWETDPQFAGLQQWLDDHRTALIEVLERNNDVLFGEWCAFRHSVKYTRLPGYFLAFDIFDRRVGRFLSRQSFHSRLHRAGGPKIPAVPMVVAPQVFNIIDDVVALLARNSAFADEPLEGVYLRVDGEKTVLGTGESYLEDRCKLVRGEFQQAIEDEGSWRGRGKNELDMELVHSYAEQSYPCSTVIPSVTLARVDANTDAAHALDGNEGSMAKDNYPSTPHLPFSPGMGQDDTKLADCAHILSDEVIVTEKLDGGNCCIKQGQVFARTHGQPATHESFSAVKELVRGLPVELEDFEVFGENMQAIHSIAYDNITSFFYVFAIRRRGEWLPWDEVVGWAERLGLPVVPVVFQGRFESPAQLQSCLESWAREPSAIGGSVTPEGFVVRRRHGFANGHFKDNIAKYVRADHLQTDGTWKRRWKKATLGTALPPRALRTLDAPDPLRVKVFNPREKQKVTTRQAGTVELPRNFSFVLDGVAVSSTPTRKEHIIAMGEMGISLIVTLTEETPLPQEWFAGSGVRNLFVPVPNYHPPTTPQADQVLNACIEKIGLGEKVMVHCGGGKGRAGTLAACLLLRCGIEGVGGTCPCELRSDSVLSHLRDVRPGSVETERQERFIREYASNIWRRAAETPEAPPLVRAASEAHSENEEGRLMEAQLFDTAAPCAMGEELCQQPPLLKQQQQHGIASQRSSGTKEKQQDKEATRRLKDIQKRAPKFVMMVGFAGSGKSTFSKALEATGGWIRANQDDLGRKACEQAVSRAVPLVKQGKSRLVVDRCHLTRKDRAEWLDLMGHPSPKDIVCVFFDMGADECKRRAAARLDHPTIRAGGGSRIIEDQAKQLERPAAGEGFGTVQVVRDFEDANSLLRRYGATPEVVPVANLVPSAPTERDEYPLSQDVATSSKPSEEKEEAEVGVDVTELLPGEFAAWLRRSVCEELHEAEAEGLLAAAEVILAGAAEDPEAAASAAEVLREGGAPKCAAELEVNWQQATAALCT